MKVVNKAAIDGEVLVKQIKAERNILIEQNHPFIVKLYYAFESPK